MKRPIAKFYSLNGVLPIEPHIDSNIKRFCQRLEEEYINGPNAGKPCNLGDWLLYCTPRNFLFLYIDMMLTEN